MAHFTEHLTFKGTPRRRSWHILNRMESVGGDLNAYTGKEETVYYCTVPREHFARAIDLLIDITLSSTFPQHEMDKEVEVVIDEIESYNDTPSELIFDEFESLIFPGHPLGRNILGQADKLRLYRSEHIQQFARRLYHPSRMVLFVYGNVPMSRIVREAEKAMGKIKDEELRRWDEKEGETKNEALKTKNGDTTSFALPTGETFVRHKDTHQAHVMLGTLGVPLHDPRHLSLRVLNSILGGPSMNSRFNLALRERHGLVYTVESSFVTYTDTGVWSVYFGCDPNDVNHCLRLVRHELDRLCTQPLSDTALRAIKRQIIGQIGLSYDAFESVAIGMAKRYLHYGNTQSRQTLMDRIQALTALDLQRTAQSIFTQPLLTLIYK